MYVGSFYVDKNAVLFSFVAGLAITFLTSILINNVVVGELPDIRLVSEPLLGVSYWGYPLPWMKQVVYPNAGKEIILSHFLINIAYWTGLVFIVEVYYLRNLKIKERVKEKVSKRVKAVREIRRPRKRTRSKIKSKPKKAKKPRPRKSRGKRKTRPKGKRKGK